MAEWINLFDLGECTVEVLSSGSELFSQVMAKGDSEAFSDGSSEGFTVAVSSAGAVSLSADGESTSYNNNQFMVFVAPSYDHDYPARITGAAFSASTSTAVGVINEVLAGPDDGIQYDTLDPASPEPLDMSDLTGQRDGVGMAAAPSF